MAGGEASTHRNTYSSDLVRGHPQRAQQCPGLPDQVRGGISGAIQRHTPAHMPGSIGGLWSSVFILIVLCNGIGEPSCAIIYVEQDSLDDMALVEPAQRPHYWPWAKL